MRRFLNEFILITYYLLLIPMIIFQSTHVTIQHDEKRKWLIQTWNDFVPSGEFRNAIDYTVSFIENNKVSVIISDTLKQHAIKPEDSEYASSVIPLLFEKGVKAMAFIISEDIFTKMSLKKFADLEKEHHHNIEYFFDMEEATHWLTLIEKKIT
jgi:hypothetical protein